ncbi:MAG: arabinogalactan endo-1,4-beta-galactosidase [Bacteroidetes bacterium]|nr:MAG: arabinogalactan endo-1,4-beta-galactosidase [Bacteroidota bacterium]
MNRYPIRLMALMGLLLSLACKSEPAPPAPEPPAKPFFRGADLSYVNEMLACGAVYRDSSGAEMDPYELFARAGTDLMRVRLWHNPDWTAYSDLADVTDAIARAKAAGMQVLLDFHYSDDWADPAKQSVPAAWAAVRENTQVLGDSVYEYTYRVLAHLHGQGLLPELVQTGNEINGEILRAEGAPAGAINWGRNAALLNRALAAVRDAERDFGAEIGLMLHIAQPENALWWFAEAKAAGVTDYDWIGLSYYPLWSDYSLDSLPTALRQLRQDHGKKVMVVETAYPFALDNVDAANNILGEDALVPGYPATEAGQLGYLRALEAQIRVGNSEGLIYWEPAWVSTPCSTRWGVGSHWDNATLIGRDGRPLAGMGWYGEER